MFFQQLSLFAEKTPNLFYLTKNVNALDQTYLGTRTMKPGPNPFKVQEEDLQVDTAQQKYSGIPVFQATIGGVPSGSYFYADFNNDNTIVWASNCT